MIIFDSMFCTYTLGTPRQRSSPKGFSSSAFVMFLAGFTQQPTHGVQSLAPLPWLELHAGRSTVWEPPWQQNTNGSTRHDSRKDSAVLVKILCLGPQAKDHLKPRWSPACSQSSYILLACRISIMRTLSWFMGCISAVEVEFHLILLDSRPGYLREFGEQHLKSAQVSKCWGPVDTPGILHSVSFSGPVIGGTATKTSEIPLGAFSYCLDPYPWAVCCFSKGLLGHTLGLNF